MKQKYFRVLVFISEILSAKTLIPIIDALNSEPDFSVKIVNDGFCLEFVQSLDRPVEYILDDFPSRIDHEIRAASVVIMGKSYIQPSEYEILRRAAQWGVPVVMLVPDMGIDVVRAKLKGIGNASDGIPFPKLLMADQRTCESLRKMNVPKDCIVEFGNPYFDALYEELLLDQNDWTPDGVGYFSTPFELDFDRGILPADYRQKDLIEDIKTVCANLGQSITGKRHPQVDPALFGGMEVFEGTPLEMIRRTRVAVGSYSTTLLEAYAAGIPTFSYQPWDANIRQDVFRDRIPILKSVPQLQEAIQQAISNQDPRDAPKFITFNPGNSLITAVKLIREHLLPK